MGTGADRCLQICADMHQQEESASHSWAGVCAHALRRPDLRKLACPAHTAHAVAGAPIQPASGSAWHAGWEVTIGFRHVARPQEACAQSAIAGPQAACRGTPCRRLVCPPVAPTEGWPLAALSAARRQITKRACVPAAVRQGPRTAAGRSHARQRPCHRAPLPYRCCRVRHAAAPAPRRHREAGPGGSSRLPAIRPIPSRRGR